MTCQNQIHIKLLGQICQVYFFASSKNFTIAEQIGSDKASPL